MKNIRKFNRFINEKWSGAPSGKYGYEVSVKGFNFIVDGHYSEGSDLVMYYSDGDGDPGSPDEFDIISIIGHEENGEQFTIWDYNTRKKLKTIEERKEYDEASYNTLMGFDITFNELSEAVIEKINNNYDPFYDGYDE